MSSLVFSVCEKYITNLRLFPLHVYSSGNCIQSDTFNNTFCVLPHPVLTRSPPERLLHFLFETPTKTPCHEIYLLGRSCFRDFGLYRPYTAPATGSHLSPLHSGLLLTPWVSLRDSSPTTLTDMSQCPYEPTTRPCVSSPSFIHSPSSVTLFVYRSDLLLHSPPLDVSKILIFGVLNDCLFYTLIPFLSSGPLGRQRWVLGTLLPRWEWTTPVDSPKVFRPQPHQTHHRWLRDDLSDSPVNPCT